MICWITLRGSAVGSACAAIAHRLSPGWTTTLVRLRYTADGGGPLPAASALVAPPIQASTATSNMAAMTSADTTIRPRLVRRVRGRLRIRVARTGCPGARRAARRSRSSTPAPGFRRARVPPAAHPRRPVAAVQQSRPALRPRWRGPTAPVRSVIPPLRHGCATPPRRCPGALTRHYHSQVSRYWCDQQPGRGLLPRYRPGLPVWRRASRLLARYRSARRRHRPPPLRCTGPLLVRRGRPLSRRRRRPSARASGAPLPPRPGRRPGAPSRFLCGCRAHPGPPLIE